MRNAIIWLMSIMSIAMIISTASALPEILDVFNLKYGTTGMRLDSCETCHIPGRQIPTCDEICHVPNKPVKESDNLNPYGKSIKDNLQLPIDQALAVIETLDSDGDHITNIDEIHNLTFPGDKKDFQKGNKKIDSPVINLLNLSIP